LHAILIILLLLVTTPAFAQRPVPPRDRPPSGRAQDEAPRGTAVVRGFVVAADNGSPIRRAQVRVFGQGAGNRLATTDPQGRFEVRDLPAGRYNISAAKGGFVSLQYGQKRPSESGTPLEIADGQVLDKLVIALPRGSVISGRITDEFGEPVANAVVTAMRYGFAAGARRLLPGGGQNSRDTTDDQGQFRLFGLSPGDYVVSAAFRQGGEATDPSGENTGYAPTYYPGTTSVAEAQRVSVAIGQEQSSVIFSLIATRLVRVTGAVLNSQGSPVTDGNVMLTPVGSGRVNAPPPMSNFGARLDAAGQFRLTSVPPGRYIAQVRSGRGRGNAAAAGEFGRQEITVGGQDLDGVVLVTAPAARVTGYIVGESGAGLTITPRQVSVGARAVELDTSSPGGNNSARVNDDWSFEISGLYEPRVIRVNAPEGWALKSVTVNGQDITDTPLEVTPGQTVGGVLVTLTERITEVSGRLADSRNNPITDATVVIFPADDDKWVYQSRFIRAARPDQDGRFQIRGLPPYDDYLAIAVYGLEDGQAGDPEFLATVRDRATRLSLHEGETRSLDLRLGDKGQR
jgi:protocatechuate 3,4-dioxygenase beta subunit